MSVLERVLGRFTPRAALRRALKLMDAGEHKHAFPLLSRAAKAGIAEAEFRIGRCYLEGTGVPQSRTDAVRWMERAAGRGYVEAQALLATLCLHGLSPTHVQAGAAGGGGLFTPVQGQLGEADFPTAAKWARLAAEAGSAEAQALLAFILASGPEDMRDPAESERLYKLSAEAKCPQGQLGYAMILARDTTDPKVQVELVRHLSEASEKGLSSAMYLYGMVLDRGVPNCLEQDRAAAAAFYRQAAEKGHRSAQARWGYALMNGTGTDRNPVEGESWLRRAALGGDPEAAAMVGDLYAKGGGQLPPNYAEAAMWFRRAMEAGHKGAARALGMLHLTGAGVPRDQEEAARLFRVSADGGNAHSRVDLGNLILRGHGHDDDSVRTREWFEQAAAAGDLIAAFNFGVCLAQGVGIEKDERKAAEWLRKAAEGVVNAQFWYGRMLMDGRGVEQNQEEGRIWIKRAADVGMLDAEVLLADTMLNGRGGPKDHPAALVLFEKAAAAGHVGAMFAVGAMKGGGHDVPWDRPAAQRAFQAAAERGHPYAQLMLGRYLARNLGGVLDVEAARLWLQKALAQGIEDAKTDLAALPPPASESAPASAPLQSQPQAVGG